MNWGKSIFLSFVIFAGIIITMVYISMSQSVNLVEKNYYEEEIAFQDQIDRTENFNRLLEKPAFKKSDDQLTLLFPTSMVPTVGDGQIHLFRHSNSIKDKKYKLTLDSEGSQVIPLHGIDPGLWVVKLRWQSAGQEYYTSETIIL